MLPIHLDPSGWPDLLVPDEAASARLAAVLELLLARRVLPYYRRHRMVEAVRLAQVAERLAFARLEDPDGRVPLPTVTTASLDGWTVHFHERLYDLLAFLVPSDPSVRLADAGDEPRRALALAELLLRHETGHALEPGTEEEAAIREDLRCAMIRRADDPTFYLALREALSGTPGLDASRLLALLDLAESEAPLEGAAAEAAAGVAETAAALPVPVLSGAARLMGVGDLARALRSALSGAVNEDAPLGTRSRRLVAAARLIVTLAERDRAGASAALERLAADAGPERLWRELELPGEPSADGARLLEVMTARLAEMAAPAPQPPPAPAVRPASGPRPSSLKERIEAARQDPRFPREALELVERHRGSLSGVSGAKYTELVETLLSIPWGRIHPIRVSPEAFVAHLDRSHYGLENPKRALADFFTNLIWRYRAFREEDAGTWRRTGSAFLFVGPPGVGKTSLAISVAEGLGLPYHKASLGGMRDESDLRGHGFTYEGSKPGAILQGLIRMGVMNGMFILDEADKCEAFAVATLLEILDFEQNHLFHDKYITTAVDIDLSNCHFVLTANTLETVPAPVIDRCEVIRLDRYAVEEKVAIAETHLLPRLRSRYDIPPEAIDFPPEEREELLRFLVTAYTREAGVRQLERLLRTLLLRLHRTEVLAGRGPVRITREVIRRTLEAPPPPPAIPPEDRVGEAVALGVNVERGVGTTIPIQATPIPGGEEGEGRGPLSMVHATGNIAKVMDESRTVALTAILGNAAALGIDPASLRRPLHLHFLGASTPKDGPSAGAAIALALASRLSGVPLRRDVAITGEIDTVGRITGVGGLAIKLETAAEAGCTTVIVPAENLEGDEGIARLPAALRRELQVLTFDAWRGEHEPFDPARHQLQVVAVRHVLEAAEVALVREAEIEAAVERAAAHGRAAALEIAAGRCGAQVVYVKGVEELAPGFMDGPLCPACTGCHVITVPEAAQEVAAATEGRPGRRAVAALDGEAELDRALEAARKAAGTACPVTVVGPHFWLRGLELPPGVRRVATNYTLQGIKLKGIKPLMVRIACLLGRLEPATAAACPLATERDGIVVADLGFIPEKYRLDPWRAERILSRAIEAWIEAALGRADSVPRQG